MSGMFGGGSNKEAMRLQQQEAERAQRRQLAALASQAAEMDQEKAKASSGKGGSKRGRKLLTYIGGGAGEEMLG